MPDGASLAADVASRGQYLFSVSEYRLLPVNADARLELIERIVVPMPPVGPAHYAVTYLIEQALRPAVEPAFRVRVESAIELGERTQVQPDISVVRSRADEALSPLIAPGLGVRVDSMFGD